MIFYRGKFLDQLKRIFEIGCLLWLCLALPLARGEEAAAADSAQEKSARTEADAKVDAAKTPFDKMNSLYLRALLAEKLKNPDAKDWEQAAADLREAVRLAISIESDGKTKITGAGIIYFEQGYVATQLQRYADALVAYNAAEKAGYLAFSAGGNRKGAELFANRASVKAVLNDDLGAVADYDAAIALADGAAWRQYRAKAHYNRGDLPRANADWERARELDGDIGKDPFDPAQVPFNRAIADNPNRAALLIERAHFFFKKVRDNAPPDAADAFDQYFSDENGRKARRLDPALADLNRAVALEPKSAVALIERGRKRLVYMSLTDGEFRHSFEFDETEQDFVQAIALDRQNAEAWFELGMTRLALWSKAERSFFNITVKEEDKIRRRDTATRGAIAAFSRAIYLQPEASGEAHFRRAGVERQLAHPDAITLLADYTAAIAQKLSPTDSAWQALVRRDPSPPDPAALSDAYLTRGRIVFPRGKVREALADFDGAVAANEGSLDAHFERGKLRVRTGDYDGAIEDLSRVITPDARVGEVWLWRGVAHDGKGEIELATADFKTAISRDAKLASMVRGSRYDGPTPASMQGLALVPLKEDMKVLPPGHRPRAQNRRQRPLCEKRSTRGVGRIQPVADDRSGFHQRAQ